jgi:hypothetical protein
MLPAVGSCRYRFAIPVTKRTFAEGGDMDTGYEVREDVIYGPESPGKYWIEEGYIWGPHSTGEYWIEEGHIYGPSSDVPWISHSSRETM